MNYMISHIYLMIYYKHHIMYNVMYVRCFTGARKNKKGKDVELKCGLLKNVLGALRMSYTRKVFDRLRKAGYRNCWNYCQATSFSFKYNSRLT